MQNLDSVISAGVAGTAGTGAITAVIPPTVNEPILITVFRLLLPSIVSIVTYFLHSKLKEKNSNNNSQ
jgi:hypothetical protein